jgi:hypothetical protein
MRVIAEAFQQCLFQPRRHRANVVEQIVFDNDPLHFERWRTRSRVRHVGVAVLEKA